MLGLADLPAWWSEIYKLDKQKDTVTTAAPIFHCTISLGEAKSCVYSTLCYSRIISLERGRDQRGQHEKTFYF